MSASSLSPLNSMKPHKSASQQEAAFDMTPMIDVVFLLIIFFMCVTEMAKLENENLLLPRASEGVKDSRPGPRQVINVTYRPYLQGAHKTSQIIVKGKPYPHLKDLEGYLKGQAHLTKSTDGKVLLQVRIRADGRAPYQRIQQVMTACMKAGIKKISFGTTTPDTHGL